MKKTFDKIKFSDNTYIIPPKITLDNLFYNEAFEKQNNLKKSSTCFLIKSQSNIKNNARTAKNTIFSDFDKGITSNVTDYINTDLVGVKSALKLKESLLCNNKDQFTILDSQNISNSEKHIYSTSINVFDKLDNVEEINNYGFSITDNVKIIDTSIVFPEIPIFQKDYTENKFNERLYYVYNGKKFAATGELDNGIFKWYLNYDFPIQRDINVEYMNSNQRNTFSSTQNIFLTYAKSNLFAESKKIAVKLLPVSLDGTPINQIKLDLNQNFINPISLKFNFNSLGISGNGFILNGNTLKTYSTNSYVRGITSFTEKVYIKSISDNGSYSLCSTGQHIPSTNLYKVNSLFKKDEGINFKILPYRYDNEEYEFQEKFIYNSLECLDCMWEIKGTGEWRNIIYTIDNDNSTNYGNLIDIDPISYRYDVFSGWKGTNKEGVYEEFVSNVFGEIASFDENHEWGIGESDGEVEYSVDNGITWHKESRGLIGDVLKWRSLSSISYLIVWKNNNKEIIKSNSGILNIEVESFGGICFEKGEELKIKIDNSGWIDIINGDEISGVSFKKIEWQYTGNKFILIKDLRDCCEIESEDIENQGFHYGRIGVYTNGKSVNNFYRLLGINDNELDIISLNPLFSWRGNDKTYVVDFRGVSYNELEYECGKIEINYPLNQIGSHDDEIIFDSNGFDISDLGFLEYREYAGDKEIEIMTGEVVGIYLYDSMGKEFVLTYDIKMIDSSKSKVKFFDNEGINWNGVKVIILYMVNKWSETHFRADLEIINITDDQTHKVSLKALKTPLKAYLYNKDNEEVQFPIKIEGNLIEIDTNELGDDECIISRVVIIERGDIDCKGILCQKFDYIEEERETYYAPLVSIYQNMYLPNKIDNNLIKTIFPNNVKKTLNYVICQEKLEKNENKILSKVLVKSTRPFNSLNNNFKTFVKTSDDMRFWTDWKEFNEEFDLCEYGKFFIIKISSFVIKESLDTITEIHFAFERLQIAKNGENDKIYFSPGIELNKDTLYMIRVKSYNGVNYSEWSNTECYLTGKEDLNNGATDLKVSGVYNRQINKVEFSWTGNQNILLYDNTTSIDINNTDVKDLIKGKEYYWQVKDNESKNSENVFSVNIKPLPPTFD